MAKGYPGSDPSGCAGRHPQGEGEEGRGGYAGSVLGRTPRNFAVGLRIESTFKRAPARARLKNFPGKIFGRVLCLIQHTGPGTARFERATAMRPVFIFQKF